MSSTPFLRAFTFHERPYDEKYGGSGTPLLPRVRSGLPSGGRVDTGSGENHPLWEMSLASEGYPRLVPKAPRPRQLWSTPGGDGWPSGGERAAHSDRQSGAFPARSTACASTVASLCRVCCSIQWDSGRPASVAVVRGVDNRDCLIAFPAPFVGQAGRARQAALAGCSLSCCSL